MIVDGTCDSVWFLEYVRPWPLSRTAAISLRSAVPGDHRQVGRVITTPLSQSRVALGSQVGT